MAELQDHIEAIENYVKYGYEPGSCTYAILENDLVGACSHADMTTRYILFDIVQYLYNHVSREVWGSPQRVRDHMQRMRLAQTMRSSKETI
jgi:hypothetical protein